MCRRTKFGRNAVDDNEPVRSMPHRYTVVYDSESHWSVLTQRLGSVWDRVLPYCLVNVLLMVGLHYLHAYIGNHPAMQYSLELGAEGHKFMKFIVAFLVVSRIKMSLDRYNEARSNIGILYRESRELIQNTCVFTQDQLDPAAKDWRMEMAYRTLLHLRSSMAVLNYSVSQEAAWQLPELNGEEKDQVKRNLLINPVNYRYAIDENTLGEENMRVPILVSFMLAETINEQGKRLKNPIAQGQENKLYDSLDTFMEGYYGLRKFITTPVPFPLIQMAKTFLFLYVYTIPFVMLTDTSGLAAHCFFVVLITLGFIGLEVVAMELDNPFGDDPNDFNNLGLAETANEDTYLTMLDVDGEVWADKLRARMRNQKRESKLLNEQTPLVRSIVNFY